MTIYGFLKAFQYARPMFEGCNGWAIFDALAGFAGLNMLVKSDESDMPLSYSGTSMCDSNDGLKIFTCFHSSFSILHIPGLIIAPRLTTIIKAMASKSTSNLFMPAWSSNKTNNPSNTTTKIMLIKSGRTIFLAVKNLRINLLKCCVWVLLYAVFKIKLAIKKESTYGTRLQAKCRLKLRLELENKKSVLPTTINIDNVISLNRFFNSQYSLIKDLLFFILKPQRSRYASTFITNYSA